MLKITATVSMAVVLLAMHIHALALPKMGYYVYSTDVVDNDSSPKNHSFNGFYLGSHVSLNSQHMQLKGNDDLDKASTLSENQVIMGRLWSNI